MAGHDFAIAALALSDKSAIFRSAAAGRFRCRRLGCKARYEHAGAAMRGFAGRRVRAAPSVTTLKAGQHAT